MSYLVIGLEGETLTARERAWLARDEVGGVIVFTRNFASPDQLARLLDAVRAVDADSLVVVDQEGGRVQRIREPATVLPPLGRIGAAFDADAGRGLALAMAHGQLMASEMLALGIDMSLAPVLDLDRGCTVIGDRALHAEPDAVKGLGAAYIKGMATAGMQACGKHFPGHGSVREDTHLEVAVDPRDEQTLLGTDMVPFTVNCRRQLTSLMMSHVVYPAWDPAPAGYSSRWIQGMVRERMGFEGVVFSDDLGMAAACGVGGFEARLHEAMDAGSDLVLVCRPADTQACFAEVKRWPEIPRDRRGELHGRRSVDWQEFAASAERRELQEQLEGL
ncbi:MAG: beta-N-acetylhexosaminidase [Pseudomonadota bacterium]